MSNEILSYFRNLSKINSEIIVEQIPEYEYPNWVLTLKDNKIFSEIKSNITEVEIHIKNQLLSSNKLEKLTGYLSVIFWGHVGNSKNNKTKEGRAFSKVILTGFVENKGKIKSDCQGIIVIENSELNEICSTIDNVYKLASKNSFAEAIKFATTLKQLGFSFASKLIMFLNPENCGVLDSVIANNFSQEKLSNKSKYLSNNLKNQLLYEEYCNWLRTSYPYIKNGNIKRAVDLERYLFSLKP